MSALHHITKFGVFFVNSIRLEVYATRETGTYLSILQSWANSSIFMLTYGQRLPSKPSHLEYTNVGQFVYKIIFLVLEKFTDIIFTYTHFHTSCTQLFNTSFHFNYNITPFFAFFFMLFHTRPLSRVYVFVLGYF